MNDLSKRIFVDWTIRTIGKGLWSTHVRDVKCNHLLVPYVNDSLTHGELRVYFDMSTWDVEEHGLIYTDPRFEMMLKVHLMDLGISAPGVKSVSYSEQGMQGDNFVSFDVGPAFLRDWEAYVSV